MPDQGAIRKKQANARPTTTTQGCGRTDEYHDMHASGIPGGRQTSTQMGHAIRDSTRCLRAA